MEKSTWAPEAYFHPRQGFEGACWLVELVIYQLQNYSPHLFFWQLTAPGFDCLKFTATSFYGTLKTTPPNHDFTKLFN